MHCPFKAWAILLSAKQTSESIEKRYTQTPAAVASIGSRFMERMSHWKRFLR
jgi:hypothetical protein